MADTFRFLRSWDGSERQSDGAGAAAGVGAPGRPLPALVLRMATRRQEERGRVGGNHQGGCLTLPVGRSQSWEVTGVNAASAGNSLLMLTSAIKHHLKSLFHCLDDGDGRSGVSSWWGECPDPGETSTIQCSKCLLYIIYQQCLLQLCNINAHCTAVCTICSKTGMTVYKMLSDCFYFSLLHRWVCEYLILSLWALAAAILVPFM